MARLTNAPPELVSVIVAVKGMGWICGAFYMLRARAKRAKMQPSIYGMVASVQTLEQEYIATVEYTLPSGEKKKLKWHCTDQPTLGQSVALVLGAGGAEDVTVAEHGDTIGGILVCFAVGIVLIGASLWIALNADSLRKT